MKRPSFQFYPGDWQSNSNLRRCTHAEKGVWLDVMCLMHDQPEYGQLRWPLKEIAQAVGAPVSLLRGLITKGVLKGDDTRMSEPFVYTPRSGRKDGEPVTLVDTQDGPLWYSSRMVKDEYVRTIRGESSRFGGAIDGASKQPPNDSPKYPFGDGSSSSSSSSPSGNPSSLRSEGEGADAPTLPSAEKPEKPKPPKPRREDCTLAAFLSACRTQGVKPVPDDHAIRRWAADAGITDEMLQIAWIAFRERYTDDVQYRSKRYRDWSGTFANAVKDSWFGLWYRAEDSGEVQWTSKGLLRKQALDARHAAHEEAAHATA